jgi:ribonucleotide monophosphatase NagD (HAD superfamily)
MFLVQKAKEIADFEISNCYMIGDNPRGDIRGANAMGWTSILVK